MFFAQMLLRSRGEARLPPCLHDRRAQPRFWFFPFWIGGETNPGSNSPNSAGWKICLGGAGRNRFGPPPHPKKGGGKTARAHPVRFIPWVEPTPPKADVASVHWGRMVRIARGMQTKAYKSALVGADKPTFQARSGFHVENISPALGGPF